MTRKFSIEFDDRELALLTIACAFYGTTAATALKLRDPEVIGALVLSMMEEDRDPTRAQLLAMRAVVEKIAQAMGLPPPPPGAMGAIFG